VEFEITAVLPGAAGQKIRAEEGANLLKSLQNAGIYVPAVCGGRFKCGKCAVKVTGGSLPPSAADRARFSPEELKAGWRLACTAVLDGGITVEIPESGEGQFASVDAFMLNDIDKPVDVNSINIDTDIVNKSPSYSIAIDIGTTTLGFALIDTNTGKTAGRFSAVNQQRRYGGDVISRIQYANSGGLPVLTECIRRQIAGGVAALCGEAKIAAGEIRRTVIAGNTTMLHLLLGLSCQSLGKAPFTPVTLDLTVKEYQELFGGDCSHEVIILPGISTYVGADITAGIFFTGLYRRRETAVLMDIGTNGEMALARAGTILCTATAAGPAFEGGNILWGTGSVPGAISRVRFNNGVFETGTIGGKPPGGICGSGVVDIVHEGLKHGFILSSGRFGDSVTPDGIVLAKNSEGRDIVFCQKDVRELQLAKSAIRTGLDALLNHAGIDYGRLDRLYIAGGFGFSLNLESAAGIGLLPKALLPRVSLVGNSSLGGAVQFLLNPGSENTLAEIARQAAEFSLPDDDFFNEQFIENINFA
jgi:uncharacterized 2Fe-2S/4Fe-4S cluster protein (DUF4445 family)